MKGQVRTLHYATKRLRQSKNFMFKGYWITNTILLHGISMLSLQTTRLFVYSFYRPLNGHHVVMHIVSFVHSYKRHNYNDLVDHCYENDKFGCARGLMLNNVGYHEQVYG